MRAFALFLILFAELAILVGMKGNLTADKISLISTLIVVLVVAFTTSAILNQFKSIRQKNNYIVSSIVGIGIAIFYYVWIKSNMDRMIAWLEQNGLYFLLLIIAVCSLLLFFSNRKKKIEAEIEMNEESAANP